MKPTLKTLKPVDQLRPHDLAAFPVWAFASEDEGESGRDETWVRPIDAKHIPKNAYSLFVSATLTTPLGVQYTGIVSVTTADAVEITHAAILTEKEYIFVPWPGMPRASTLSRNIAKQLGMETNDLFPLFYRLEVPIDGETATRTGEYRYDESDT